MPGEAVTLGPFVGGFTNRAFDPATIEDTTLLVADNFVFDSFGNLVTRPPVVEDNVDLGSSELEVLGWYLMPSDSPPPTSDVVDVLVVTSDDGTWVRVASGTWQKISNYKHEDCLVHQFGGKGALWFPASIAQAGTGGYWRLTDSVIQTFSNIPQARSITFYEQRIVFGNIATSGAGIEGSYLIYSSDNPGTNGEFDWNNLDPDIPEGKQAPSYIVVKPEYGDTIQKLVTYYDSVVVLKDNSTHLYSFTLNDTSRAQVKTVSPTVGTPNNHTAVVVDDILYTLHGEYIYRFTGQSFTPLSVAVDIPGSDDTSLSNFERKLIARRGSTYYVFDLDVNAYTTWTTARLFNWLVRRPEPYNPNDILYAGGRVGQNDLVTVQNGYSGTRVENFTSRMQTKYYDFQLSDRFKRLFSWGAYVKTNGAVRGAVDVNSEARETSEVWDSTSYPDFSGMSPYGYFYKFLKGYRFRQISFALELDVDGSYGAVVASLMPVIRTGQYTVGKALTSV